MSHVIEPATSGRAKCRGCGEKIAKDELRFGEVTENPYGDGDRTLWFHPVCGAFKRPETFIDAASSTEATLDAIPTPAPDGKSGAWLLARSRVGIGRRRLPRIDGASRAPTGRARCRSCREPIEKDTWRVGLVYYEDGYFAPSGFIHVGCWRAYFDDDDADDGNETKQELAPDEILTRLAQFSPGLSSADLAEIGNELNSTTIST